jgi:hypothetical protein
MEKSLNVLCEKTFAFLLPLQLLSDISTFSDVFGSHRIKKPAWTSSLL